ncbi:formin-like protein 20 [Dorcoceras hygrometricum]|uniref:Formin-like protein 20 n=1 Tax=Dorcoceras hygrometricum TaxID=472368 RepID=A0A2Z7DAY6_9LAMI|nr:formin-like protein 20 [Dorcoceras hygrometricum]
MLRAALGRTPVATSAAHGAGCANRWRNSSSLVGHSTRDLARHSGEGGGNSWPPMRNNCAACCATQRHLPAAMRGQRAWDTASRGPTTIVAPESQFRTCPSDHDSIAYPRMSASGESSTTMHRLLHASGSHTIPPPDDPNSSAYSSSPLLSYPCRRRRRHRRRCRKSHSDHSGEEIPFVKTSPSFLVQIEEGIGIPVVDRIRRPNPPTVECRFPREIGRSQASRRQQGTILNILCMFMNCFEGVLIVPGLQNFKSSAVPRERDPDPPLRQQWYQSFGSDLSIHFFCLYCIRSQFKKKTISAAVPPPHDRRPYRRTLPLAHRARRAHPSCSNLDGYRGIVRASYEACVFAIKCWSGLDQLLVDVLGVAIYFA